MRTRFLSVLLLPFFAAPLPAQTCAKTPPPFLPSLLPEAALGMALELASDPTGGCAAMYRPTSQADRQRLPWAMVSLEANPHPDLGEDAAAIRTRLAGRATTVLEMAGWPVSMRQAPLGDEFVALKGSVRVTVLIKNGDQGEKSRALARALMDRILPAIPCG